MLYNLMFYKLFELVYYRFSFIIIILKFKGKILNNVIYLIIK
jgi:hypothetical protein